MPERARQLEGPVAYRALADRLREALDRGDFDQGRRLPTELELSETYGVGRQTVRRALQDLVSEGSVYRVRGRGTFATPSVSQGQYVRSFGSIDDLLSVSQDTRLEIVVEFERQVNPEAAGRLQLPTDDVFAAVTRRLHGDAPIFVTRVYLPTRFAEHVRSYAATQKAKPRGATIIGMLSEVLPEPVVGAHQSINAVAMPDELAPLLDIAPGAVALRIDRVFFDSSARPVELAISFANPARYSYRIELRQSVTGADAPAPRAAREPA